MDEENIKDMPDSELFIALASPVGTDSSIVFDVLKENLTECGYFIFKIKISSEMIIPELADNVNMNDAFERLSALMDKGNELREKNGNNAILSLGVLKEIVKIRTKEAEKNAWSLKGKKYAYIIDSLKHKEEVKLLRSVYTNAFYLFAINESERDRENYLINHKNMGKLNASKLIARDQYENFAWGQHTRDVFELADFHVTINSVSNANKNNGYSKERDEIKKQVNIQISRIVDLMFGCPYHTATFEEYAMFMAYSTALRSGDLSRQVGAVIATDDNEIISMGANETPKYGGGQYWADIGNSDKRGWNVDNGRDMMLRRDDNEDTIMGYDPNKTEIQSMVKSIVEDTDCFNYDSLEMSATELEKYKKDFFNGLYNKLKSITEFGRTVHAEMAAMLSCARHGIALDGATLYCSTFPCHNCARHAVYSGIKRIVYIEPYPKSKALELHRDSTTINHEDGKVIFDAFTGVGPRRFFDLFSLKLSSGYDVVRKNEQDDVVVWERRTSCLRCSSNPIQYVDRETKEIYDACVVSNENDTESLEEKDE